VVSESFFRRSQRIAFAKVALTATIKRVLSRQSETKRLQGAGMSELTDHNAERVAFVLDDEPEMGAVVCRVLATIGIATKQFTDPLHFLLELKACAPDVVVLDLALGRSDAIDVMRKMEGLKFAGRVLLLSGKDEATLREIERIGGAHGLAMLPSLQKPFRAVELKERLQSAAEPRTATPAPSAAMPSGVSAAEQHAALARALRDNSLELWYQPKIDLQSLSICGAEALIRAYHPTSGLLEPSRLLPPAGDPLYKPLALFVVRQAMADWKKIAACGKPVKLAINVPASILSAPGFVDYVRNKLPDDPSFPGLIVEVTEDEVIRDLEWIHEVATQLRIYNVWLSIDDFGSAYSSLSRLKDLPFREIKLDRSFVTNCAGDPLKRGICQTVVDLARCFNAVTCAEGVETVEDLRCLMELGFETAQGFLFAKPMRLDQFLSFVVQSQGALSESVATDERHSRRSAAIS
jgi:EAL domain-containing protein (putative c-di-GMP-specific phosphodiesterase class I)/FixJ family two-component response regulator